MQSQKRDRPIHANEDTADASVTPKRQKMTSFVEEGKEGTEVTGYVAHEKQDLFALTGLALEDVLEYLESRLDDQDDVSALGSECRRKGFFSGSPEEMFLQYMAAIRSNKVSLGYQAIMMFAREANYPATVFRKKSAESARPPTLERFQEWIISRGFHSGSREIILLMPDEKDILAAAEPLFMQTKAVDLINTIKAAGFLDVIQECAALETPEDEDVSLQYAVDAKIDQSGRREEIQSHCADVQFFADLQGEQYRWQSVCRLTAKEMQLMVEAHKLIPTIGAYYSRSATALSSTLERYRENLTELDKKKPRVESFDTYISLTEEKWAPLKGIADRLQKACADMGHAVYLRASSYSPKHVLYDPSEEERSGDKKNDLPQPAHLITSGMQGLKALCCDVRIRRSLEAYSDSELVKQELGEGFLTPDGVLPYSLYVSKPNLEISQGIELRYFLSPVESGQLALHATSYMPKSQPWGRTLSRNHWFSRMSSQSVIDFLTKNPHHAPIQVRKNYLEQYIGPYNQLALYLVLTYLEHECLDFAHPANDKGNVLFIEFNPENLADSNDFSSAEVRNFKHKRYTLPNPVPLILRGEIRIRESDCEKFTRRVGDEVTKALKEKWKFTPKRSKYTPQLFSSRAAMANSSSSSAVAPAASHSPQQQPPPRPGNASRSMG